MNIVGEVPHKPIAEVYIIISVIYFSWFGKCNVHMNNLPGSMIIRAFVPYYEVWENIQFYTDNIFYCCSNCWGDNRCSFLKQL